MTPEVIPNVQKESVRRFAYCQETGGYLFEDSIQLKCII